MAFKDFYRNNNLQFPSSQSLKMMTTTKLKPKRKIREEKALTLPLSVPSFPITKKEECFSHAEFGYKAMGYDSTTGSFICCTQKSEGKKTPPKNSGSIDK